MPIRVTKFVSGSPIVGFPNNVFACPANTTCIVKNVQLCNVSGGATNVQVSLFDGGAGLVDIAPVQALANNSVLRVDGEWVLKPGDAVLVFTATNPVTMWLSGVKLAGVA